MTGNWFKQFFITRHGREYGWAVNAAKELHVSDDTIHRLIHYAKIPDKYAAKVEKLKGTKP